MLFLFQRIHEYLWTQRPMALKMIRSRLLLLGTGSRIRRTQTNWREERREPSNLSIRRMFTAMLIMKAKIQTMRCLILTVEWRHLSMVVIPDWPMEKRRQFPVSAAITCSKISILNTANFREDSCNDCQLPSNTNRKLKEFPDDRKKRIRYLSQVAASTCKYIMLVLCRRTLLFLLDLHREHWIARKQRFWPALIQEGIGKFLFLSRNQAWSFLYLGVHFPRWNIHWSVTNRNDKGHCHPMCCVACRCLVRTRWTNRHFTTESARRALTRDDAR